MYHAANLVSETCLTKWKKEKKKKTRKRMTGLANNCDPPIWSLLPVLKPVNTRCFIQYNWRNFKCRDCSPDFKNRKPPCTSWRGNRNRLWMSGLKHFHRSTGDKIGRNGLATLLLCPAKVYFYKGVKMAAVWREKEKKKKLMKYHVLQMKPV